MASRPTAGSDAMLRSAYRSGPATPWRGIGCGASARVVLSPPGELPPRLRAECQHRARAVFRVAHEDVTGRGHLDALAAVSAAVTRLAPGQGACSFHRSCITPSMRSRDAPLDRASP